MDRFGVGGRSVFSGSASVFLGSFMGGGCFLVGLKAPYMLKLNVAIRHCSIMYGKADSRRLPIICLDISKPANCYAKILMFHQSITEFINYDNYFFELLLIPQVECDVEQ